tara:strand:- start:117 stop:371 length:255 start_codon:yes stop_codon:yes gene_type:complete
MINELKTIDILETAIDKIDDGKIEDAKDDLQTYKDELQKEVDEFEKWAESESNKNYSEEHIKQMTDPKHNQWGVAGEPKKGGVH